ncbi:hypothetical protein FGADI_5277 [Fusarium gaditjirri]|uniref:Uncharacterized protein n=1 Tax=Fusarium gaditjirri TaxID=282569 RepID=A0A8H4TAV7_9HYPO|nr:hypothetical protein FGADI_5277 [Fusarium gaditjirri]
MAKGSRSKSDFPSLNSSEFSQATVDQQALAAIKKIWDKHANRWPEDVRQTVLRLLKLVKQTPSNLKQASSHQVWKDTDWNFGHWVVMNGIYGPGKLSKMNHQLREKYPSVSFDNMDGPGFPDEESDDNDDAPSPIHTKASNLKSGKRTKTEPPSHSSSRVIDDEGQDRQKGGTWLPQPKRSARIDKRRREAVDEGSDDEASDTSKKRGKPITIKREIEIENAGEQQPGFYHRQTSQALEDFRLPGEPAVATYSTGNTGIADPKYHRQSGDRQTSGGYYSTSNYRMSGDRQASGGYHPTSRDYRSPYPERDSGQRGRLSDTPIREEIEPAAIVRLRQEMNTRLQGQANFHFEEIRSLRDEMRAMREEFDRKLFANKREHDQSIIDLANQASLAGHDNV